MNDTTPYIQRPNDFHQCFEYVSHDTRCTETAIVGEYFCVHHRIEPSPIILHPTDGFYIPALTDRDSIVRVASDIAGRLAYKAIDDKRAGKILYACQIANQALEGKLRDQKLALQQAAATDAQQPQPPSTSTSTDENEAHTDPDASTAPNKPVILSERSEPKDPRISAPTNLQPPPQPLQPVILSERSEPKDPRISEATNPEPSPQPLQPVILSEARSAPPKDPRISEAPNLQPSPQPLQPVILSEARTRRETSAGLLPQPGRGASWA